MCTNVNKLEMATERDQGRQRKILNIVNNVRAKKKVREKQRCRKRSADTNLKSSRHSMRVKESGG